MVKRNWIRCLYSIGMSFLLTTSALVCLLTAFEVDCAAAAVLTWSMIGAVVWSISFMTNHCILPFGIYALVVGYLWRSGVLYDSLSGLAFSITTVYNRVRGWDIAGYEGTADVSACLYAVTMTMLTTRMLCKKRSRLPIVLVGVLPLLPCFLTTETSPQPLWLGIWLFGMTMILLPGRKQVDYKKQVVFLCVPVAVFALLLVVLLPQSGQAKPRALAQQIRENLQDKGFVPPSGTSLKVSGGAMELKKLGPREEASYPVMTVKSDMGGILYLRGCAYDTYFQSNWTNLTLPEDLKWPKESALQPAGTVSIQTEYVMEMRYFPYYVTDETLSGVTRGINNYSRLTTYSYSVSVLLQQQDTYTNRPDHSYCQLPVVALKWAQPVVGALLTENMTDAEKIAAVSNYVKSLADYSLYPEKMPEGEQDFVVWFAKTAKKGYCVHFATAGAVLLRAAGIPTRFVTGYMVNTEAGRETTVYGKDAHAWAECYLEGIGWVPVEFTPGTESVETAPLSQPTVRKFVDPAPILYGCSALLVGTIFIVLLRWQIRILLRCRKRKKGDVRSKVLAAYSQLAELLDLDSRKPSKELELIAEIAKFSNRPIDAHYCEELEKELKYAKKALNRHGILKKIHYRLILNLY